MDWARLPQGVLEQLMRMVRLGGRLKSCALVCSTWAAAAVSSTNAISTCQDSTADTVDSLVHWLDRHGSFVTQLQLHMGHGMRLASLPCPLLHVLLVNEFKVQLAPRTSQRGLLHAVTQLTHLTMQHVTVLEGSKQLTVLSVLTGLQHLVLQGVQEPGGDYAALPGSLLRPLVQLTHLQIERGLSDAALQHLSCLSALQHLQLVRLGATTTPAALSSLQALQALTCLFLEGAYFRLTSSTTPYLSTLLRLQALQLHACNGLEPVLLSKLTLLETLELWLTSVCNNRHDDSGPEPSTATERFLALLPDLNHVTALVLHYALHDRVPTAAAAYAAITASSRLQSLDLFSTAIPDEAWQHIFPLQGRQLLQLSSLDLRLNVYICQQGMDSSGLQGLVNTCPSLQQLQLNHAVQTGASLTALQQLPALTQLSISHFDDELSAGLLQRLTRLQILYIQPPNTLTDAGLLQLTALRQLRYLRVESSDPLSAVMAPEGAPGMRLTLVSWAS